MKRIAILTAVLLLVVGLTAIVGWAGDKGPQQYSASLPLGAGSLMPVATNGFGRVTPAYLIFTSATGETQTVKYVCYGVTNTYGTKVTAAGDFVLAISNIPPLFPGDKFVIASSTTAGITNTVTLVGTLFD